MTLRTRLALVAAAAVAVAVVLASGTAYFVVRHQLRSEVDRSLRERVGSLEGRPPILRRFPPPPLGGAGGYVQLVREDGVVIRAPDASVALPVDERTLEVARGARRAFFSDARVAATHVRIVTAPFAPGYALQVARPLAEEERTLRRVGLLLIVLSAGGVALALLLGLGVAEAALRPVEELTGAVDHVRETRDLTRRIDVRSRDEVGRLAEGFNEMLSALEASLQAQQQLVADASHELRTPLTSLRTNIEVLARTDALTQPERERLLRDVTLQLEELTALVNDLVELARGAERETVVEDVRLDALAERAVERARVHAPAVRFVLDAEPTIIRGDPGRLDRALANLLDNAAKWSPPGETVEVAVRNGEVSVRDHGPGIDPGDLPFVFDRFYRAASARNLPGSGLGLAIVRHVADAHRGSVTAEDAEGGGTRLRLRLPAEAEPSQAAREVLATP